MNTLRPLSVLLLTTSLAVAANPGAPEWRRLPWTRWESTLHCESPLAGKLYSVARRRYVTPAEAAERLAEAPFVLLGEIHDNADHHRLQAWMVAEVLARGRAAPVVMEMLTENQADAIAAAPTDAAGFGDAVGGAGTGWPAWEKYLPIAEAAFEGGVRLRWANIDPKRVRGAGMQGLDSLTAEERRRLGLARNLPEGLQGALGEEIVEGHCGMLPPQAVGPIADVQRWRDASFAHRMVVASREAGGAGAILIAGGGHVRRDRAVPWHLRRFAPDLAARALVLREIEAEEDAPEDYLPKDPDGNPAADFLWLTPATQRPDPCEGFRKHMAKKKAEKK
jgi:uncharacterized iron-regulated protein